MDFVSHYDGHACAGWFDASAAIAARTGYLAGVLSKLGDTALWRRTLVIAFVIAVAFEIILFLINGFSLWLHSLEHARHRRQSGK